MSTLNTSASTKAKPLGARRYRGYFPALSVQQLSFHRGEHIGHRDHERKRRESGVGGRHLAQQSGYRDADQSGRHIPDQRHSSQGSITCTCIRCRRHSKAKARRTISTCRTIRPGCIFLRTPASRRNFIPIRSSPTLAGAVITVQAGAAYPQPINFSVTPVEFARRGFGADLRLRAIIDLHVRRAGDVG